MIAVIVLLISFFLLYIALCVPSTTDTFLGKIKVFLIFIITSLYNKLPKPMQTISYSIYDYIVNKTNPIIQILYIILVAGLFIFNYN